MAFDLPASKGPLRDLATEAGHTLGFALQAIGATVVATLRRRLSLGETLSQVVFIGRVSTGRDGWAEFRTEFTSSAALLTWVLGLGEDLADEADAPRPGERALGDELV